MSLREWFIRVLGGSAEVERRGYVEVALVEAWRSGLAAAALKDEGVECCVVMIGPYPASEYLRPMARLLIDVSQAPRAREVLNALDAEGLGGGV